MKSSDLSDRINLRKVKRTIEIVYRALGGLMVTGIFAVLGWGIICGYI